MFGPKAEIGFEPRTTCFDTLKNDQLSQNVKLLGNYEFNHLIIILTNPPTPPQTTQTNTHCPSRMTFMWGF